MQALKAPPPPEALALPLGAADGEVLPGGAAQLASASTVAPIIAGIVSYRFLHLRPP